MKILWVGLVLLLLPGCGGSGGGSSGGGPDPNPPPADTGALLLPPGSQKAFQEYLIAGLEQWSGLADNSTAVRSLLVSENPQMRAGTLQATEVFATQADAGAAPAPSGAVSTTNVIVAGVDEMDAARYDGEYLYLANGSHVQIIRTHAGAPGEIVNTIDLKGADGFTISSGLHHYKSASESLLVDIRAQQMVYTLGAADAMFAPWVWVGHFGLDFIDVSTPASAQITERIEIDGAYVNSRRIGDTLYIVSRFTPEPQGLVPFAETTTDKRNNRDLLAGLTLEEMLPRVTFRDGSSVPLVSTAECFVPKAAGSEVIYSPVITTITAFDLSDPAHFDSLCMAESVEGIHVSSSAIYLSAYSPTMTAEERYYDETIIHKFAIDGARPQYVGSGKVQGTFWGDPAFLMGEHEGYLTAITSSWGGADIEHRLSILGPSGKPFELKVQGQIPNASRPQAIGKKGEQIYAARIMGDRAYIVTFMQVDPVYVVDLSAPADPRILGELEIPGFSTYLHPLGEDLLIGVGRNATDQGDFALFQGVSVRLFDVHDPAHLQVVGEYEIGRRGSGTPIAYDHHAFTIVESGGVHRFTVPVSVYGAHVPGADPSSWSWYPWTENALYLFEVDPAQRTLGYRGKLVAEDQTTGQRWQPGCCTWGERAFLAGNTLHFLHESRLFTATWDDPATRSSLFVPTLFPVPANETCTMEARASIAIDPVDRDTGQWICASWNVDGMEGTYLTGACAYGGSTSPMPLLDLSIDGADQTFYEKAGVFTLNLTAEGYQPWHTTDVHVQHDGCHVGTVWITAPMTRQ